jgi:hypothetical protein
MMKWALLSSLAINLVLAVQLYQRGQSYPPLEKLIIEQHAEVDLGSKSATTTQVVEPGSKSTVKERPQLPAAGATWGFSEGPEVEELRLHAEKMQLDRQEYLTQRLELSATQIEAVDKLKANFHQEANQFYQASGLVGELSFEERRRLIDLEEKLHQDIAKTMGEKKWQQYQKYRQQYNQKLIRSQARAGSEPAPIMLMDL